MAAWAALDAVPALGARLRALPRPVVIGFLKPPDGAAAAAAASDDPHDFVGPAGARGAAGAADGGRFRKMQAP